MKRCKPSDVSFASASFGQHIRASRLGYRWHQKTGAFIRIAAGGPPWRVDVRRGSALPSWPEGDHVCWWESPEDPFEYAIPLAPNRLYLLDDDGQSLTAEPA